MGECTHKDWETHQKENCTLIFKTPLERRKEVLGKRSSSYKPKPDEKVEVRGD